jgi:N utilization substance protein B
MLYRYDLNPDREPASDDVFIQKRLLNNSELVAFALGLLRGVLRNRDELDGLLKERAANWSLNRMAATDRNVLRMGAYEILYSDTPGRVAINEAVDLARRFGSAHSSQFVNGILDRVLQELKRDR